jgi:hypothetical protein
MPGPARLITLNLGSQTIGLAEFRAGPLNYAVPAQSGAAREILAVGAYWKSQNYGRPAQILIDIVRSFSLECRRPTLRLAKTSPNEVYGRCDRRRKQPGTPPGPVSAVEWTRAAVSRVCRSKRGPRPDLRSKRK